MIRSWTSASLVACAFFSTLSISAAFADDAPPPPPPDGWSGKGQAGYVMSRGNTDSDSGNAKLDVADLNGDWKHTLHLEGLYGRNDDLVSAERWAVQLQSNYQFTPRAFLFGAFHYLDDEFSGFEYQGDVSVGAGYKFLDSSADKLAAQIGAGCYADNHSCAVSTTGHGEWFLRTVQAYDIAARLRYGGASLAAAVSASIDERLPRLGGSGGLIAVDSHGTLEIRYNTPAMFRASVRSGEAPSIHIY